MDSKEIYRYNLKIMKYRLLKELCDFFGFFTLKITRSLAPIIMKY